MILPVVLYGYELGLHPREEQREIERVWEQVLRREFELKREEATGVCRKLRSEAIHNLQSSLDFDTVIKTRTMDRLDM
jgi:hypothetical protein